MLISDLGGHSGCRIELRQNEDNSKFVRKISSSQSYNQRLQAQCQKQSDFRNPVLRCPKVLASGYTEDGLFYFDMEYVRGITLSQYISTIEVDSLSDFVSSIIRAVYANSHENKQERENGQRCEFEHEHEHEHEREHEHETNAAAAGDSDMTSEEIQNVFMNKIARLEETLGGFNSQAVNRALTALRRHDWRGNRQSFCHGDLTLENIIIRNGQIYLIDFLDSFYDSWVLDLATLLQDIECMWSYRHNADIDINLKLRLLISRDILVSEINGISEDLLKEVRYCLLLKLIRIFPYVKDQNTYNFLESKTKMVLGLLGCKE